MKHDQPNILIVYVDQMRADCLSAAGHPDLVTPNLDRIATEGVLFEQAHTCYPLCGPSRAAFMTGRYPHANGVSGNHKPIGKNPVMLGQMLCDAGYETCYAGKIHTVGGEMPGFVPEQYQCGFEEFVGCNTSHEYFHGIYYRDNCADPIHEPGFQPNIDTDIALEFLDRPRNRPFALMLSIGTPHVPCITPSQYESMFDPAALTLYPGTDENGVCLQGSYPNLPARQFLDEYYRQIINIDENVGRLLTKLDQLDITDNTLVLFTSDHGDMAGQLGHFGKTWNHYGATGVPLLMRWPGKIPPGKKISSLVDCSVDTLPTLMEAIGLDVHPATQGISYWPLALGKRDRIRDAVFYEMIEWRGRKVQPFNPLRGIRTDQYVYVRNQSGQASDASKKADASPPDLLLYDRTIDPYELTNLAKDARYAETRRELDARIERHMRETDDDWNISAGDWPPPAGYMTGSEAFENHKHLIRISKRDTVLQKWPGSVDRSDETYSTESCQR